MNATLKQDNRKLLAKLCVFVIAMFGFGYALVPFYERICEATGLRNIAQADVVKNTQVDTTSASCPGSSGHLRRWSPFIPAKCAK